MSEHQTSESTTLRHASPNAKAERPKQISRTFDSRVGPALGGLFMFLVVYKLVQENGSGATAIGTVIAMALIWRAFSGLRTS